MNTVVARGITQRRSTITVLRAVKHHVLSILHYHGRIECSCGFEFLTLGRNDGVGGKPRPLSKRRSKWNGRNGGESDENQHGDGGCPDCPSCKGGYFDHSRNSFPYDRTEHDRKLPEKVLLCGYRQTLYRSEFSQQSDERTSRNLHCLAGGDAIYAHSNGSLSRCGNRDRCRSGNDRRVVQDEI